MANRVALAMAGVVSSGILAGCGLAVPKMQRLGEQPVDQAVREATLVDHVRCEVAKAIQDILLAEPAPGAPSQVPVTWLKDWGVTASLKLVVEEKTGVSPEYDFTNPMRNVIRHFPTGGDVTAAQSQTTALAASLSADATRTETIGFSYDFDDLLKTRRITAPCGGAGGMLIDGDLRIGEFMQDKIMAARVPGLYRTDQTGKPLDGKDSPFTTFTYEVTFVVTKSGSVNPSWKLVFLSADPTTPLLSASKIRTSDLILTMGPVAGDSKAIQETHDQHLADLIGRAVRQGARGGQP